jgi:hypothetical protein
VNDPNNAPPPDGMPPTEPGVEPLFTQAELDRYAARAVAADRTQRAGRPATPQSYAPRPATSAQSSASDPMGMLNQLVALKVAETLGAMGGGAAPMNALPVSDRGSPPVPRVPLEEQDLMAMSPSDREALLAQKGNKWWHDTLTRQVRDRRFKLSR